VRPRWRSGVGQAVLSIAVVFVAACGSDEATSDPVDFGEESSLAVVDAHFAAYNKGDAQAAIALFSPDATFSNSFYGAYPRESVEEDIVWATAQGTTYVQPDCAVADAGDSVTDPTDDASVTIVCDSANLDAPSLAVGGPAVPVVMTMLIGSDGIERIDYRYGSPDFRHVTDPFERWVREHHPEDTAAVGHFNWDSTAGAEQNGLLTAEYATEWADYLKANDCTYLDVGC
jgi:hypothetical protein